MPDLDLLRGLASVAVFAAFIGISVMVYSARRKSFYEEAGRIPFQDDVSSSEEVTSSSKEDNA